MGYTNPTYKDAGTAGVSSGNARRSIGNASMMKKMLSNGRGRSRSIGSTNVTPGPHYWHASKISSGSQQSPGPMPVISNGGNKPGNSGIGKQPTMTRTETSTWTPSSDSRPELTKYEAPDRFRAPKYNEREVSSLQQKYMAPQLQTLRNAAMTVAASAHSPVGRKTLREFMSGYSSAISGIQAGAGQQARGVYGQKFGAEFDAARIQHETDRDTAAKRQADNMTMFRSEWDNWLNSGTRTKTTKTEYEDE